MRRGMALRYFVVVLWMTANPKENLNDYFADGRAIPYGQEEYSMSQREFQKMHQNFFYPIALFDELFNDKFCYFVCAVVHFIFFLIF